MNVSMLWTVSLNDVRIRRMPQPLINTLRSICDLRGQHIQARLLCHGLVSRQSIYMVFPCSCTSVVLVEGDVPSAVSVFDIGVVATRLSSAQRENIAIL
jgi:hypothetical protein